MGNRMHKADLPLLQRPQRCAPQQRHATFAWLRAHITAAFVSVRIGMGKLAAGSWVPLATPCRLESAVPLPRRVRGGEHMATPTWSHATPARWRTRFAARATHSVDEARGRSGCCPRIGCVLWEAWQRWRCEPSSRKRSIPAFDLRLCRSGSHPRLSNCSQARPRSIRMQGGI